MTSSSSSTTTSSFPPSVNVINLFNVKGRVALVTGGSSGIGFMISQGLVQNGAKVYVVDIASGEVLDGKVAELNKLGEATGGVAIGYQCDVSSKEAIANLAEYITTHETHLDMLLSNAGIRRDPPQTCNVLTASLDELQSSLWSSRHGDWDATFRVNVTAHYFLSVALIKLLAAAADMDVPGDDGGRKGRDEGRGVIVVTSSCASMHNCTNVDLMSYATSKAAIDHLVALLASKFARWYVRVNSINPGFVPSNMNPVGADGNQFAQLFAKVPAKRVGSLEDISGTILYLVSQAGAYVDGQSLVVDGGRILLANGQE